MGNQMSQSEMDVRLMQAVEKGTDEQVELLLKSGANPNKPPEEHDFLSRTALHHAALCKCSIEKLKLLLQYVRDIDVTDDAGNTAIHYATRYRNNLEFIRILIKQKPNCKIQNSRGKTALHNAVDIGLDAKIVELLLTRGDADPNIADWDGVTPLHVCSSQKSVDPMVVGMLLRFGGDPNRRDHQGQTSLHIAASTANVSVLLLLRYNARVFMKDNEGRIPSEVAITDEIRNILHWEENRIKDEGDFREMLDEYIPPIKINRNNKKRKHSKADGKGVIRLLGGPVINIPGQTLPAGSKLELTVAPSSVCSHRNNEESDEEFYDIYLDLQINLPGMISQQLNSSMSSSSDEYSATNNMNNQAFTAMCISERGEQWKSEYDVISKDMTSSLNFRITRQQSLVSVGRSSQIKRISQRTYSRCRPSPAGSINSSKSSSFADSSASSSGSEKEDEEPAENIKFKMIDVLAEDLSRVIVKDSVTPRKDSDSDSSSSSSSSGESVISQTIQIKIHRASDDDEDNDVIKVDKGDAFDSFVSQLSSGLTEKKDPENKSKLISKC